MADDITNKKELADGAKSLLEDKAFTEAILRLRKLWFAELMDEKGNTLLTSELCSKLRTLEAIPKELETLVNDFKMAMRNRA